MNPMAISVATFGGHRFMLALDGIVDYVAGENGVTYVQMSRGSGTVAVFASVHELDRVYASLMRCPLGTTGSSE